MALCAVNWYVPGAKRSLNRPAPSVITDVTACPSRMTTTTAPGTGSAGQGVPSRTGPGHPGEASTRPVTTASVTDPDEGAADGPPEEPDGPVDPAAEVDDGSAELDG
jgi:hypothetical protein